jgi:hypothetical protein
MIKKRYLQFVFLLNSFCTPGRLAVAGFFACFCVLCFSTFLPYIRVYGFVRALPLFFSFFGFMFLRIGYRFFAGSANCFFCRLLCANFSPHGCPGFA